MKEYIDFAAENGFDAVLVEGWNEGWEDNWAYGKEKIYSFTKAYPDFNVEELQAYAKARGIKSSCIMKLPLQRWIMKDNWMMLFLL